LPGDLTYNRFEITHPRAEVQGLQPLQKIFEAIYPYFLDCCWDELLPILVKLRIKLSFTCLLVIMPSVL